MQVNLFVLDRAPDPFNEDVISPAALAVHADPDVADNYVNIITRWPGNSAEDIEKQITVPTEIQMAGIPDMKNLRSFNVALAPVGGALALLVTRTNISVSSSVGFLALFGVSVQTGVTMLEYINQLRAGGHTVESAAIEGAVLRLRPIMMTMLVATLGLLPAALSHGIGSDSQRPFAIVLVGGLMVDLVMSIFLLPTLYVWIAREDDVLPSAEPEWASE